MIWILIRHAHRDTTIRALDNGLSKKGKAQAKALAKYFKKRFGKQERRILLISSPKRRCQQTLEPIARYLGRKTAVSELLLEQGTLEGSASFRRRIERFVEDYRASRKIVVICSHGDWMPLALKKLCGADADLQKGSWTEIEDGRLTRILQPEDLA